ncbi:Crp/Fnr family transcriptional regulator [Oceanospirillum sediminis]|uniref:Crp/Fnr family transcriptional regulator n=1 Tax=Oceanospirillum sediminis TaxID=2760088 RepID=A0A839IUR7_9GAMM|nr:Crp/Fnr family transcriptional regulator [Oceanospirillum sediminis]MBB1488219.1 Crp/Fnr family transcriptional regulator [Oceanospirillum sediminis]
MAVSTELLKYFPVLKGVSEPALEELASQSVLRKFARRGVVINAGDQSEYLCFLFEGRLQGVDFTLDGREVGLYFVDPGDFCGELGLFDASGQPEYVIALTKAQVVFVPATAIRSILLTHQGLVEQMFSRMAGRIRTMSAQRALLGLSNTNQRVCGQLWMLTDKKSINDEGAMEILNPPTHQEMGIMLNMSRETVTRVFQSLQKKKIVKRDGTTRLLIMEPEALKLMAEGEGE